MATWNSRGLRGSTLEDLVNRTNEQYAEKNLALIQKIPTPITPVRMDKENRHITLAYFEQRSTVDYIGAVQGSHAVRRAQKLSARRIEFHLLFTEKKWISCSLSRWNPDRSEIAGLTFSIFSTIIFLFLHSSMVAR